MTTNFEYPDKPERVFINGQPAQVVSVSPYFYADAATDCLAHINGQISDYEAKNALLILKLETIRRMIVGRATDIHPLNQCAIDDALFDLILDEIGGNDDRNNGSISAE